MSDERDERRGHDEAPKVPKVKVTDKRRVRPQSDRGAEAPTVPEQGAAPGGPPAGPADELERAKQQAAEYLDHLQRLKADFENYRKRVLKEQTAAVEFATERLVERLLEVLDEFELALMAADQRPDLDKFLRGVEMVYAKFFDILRGEGLERIEAEDEVFDPQLHEALLQTDDREGEPYVIDVLRTGYSMKGRVLRAAGVKVARR